MHPQWAALLLPQPLQELGLLFWIGACGARCHREEINGMSGLAEMLHAIRAFALEVFANVIAGALGDGAQKIQLVIFI
jgi:hypothetical protein